MVNDVKAFLITAIQDIEKNIGLTVDSEETVVNMALVYLYNTFEIGLALDSSEIVKDREKFLNDLTTVEEFIKTNGSVKNG